ncbi:MAG: Fe-S cluster assembly ATPase SufC [Chloroflexota bacterium]|jgi:Fe-S cluster assembly ATP-binding protein|nr:Fe-S cluster assembly ATPase SufC [Chloroflexota bacterium]
MAKTAPLLKVKGLAVRREGKEILRGIDLVVNRGEVHAIMGPNGSGKSTLANTLMGYPGCEVTGGSVVFEGNEILEETTDARARAGMFMAFQYPVEIPGVPLSMFLREALNARRAEDDEISAREFRTLIVEKMEMLKMDLSFVSRYLNEGFSGGEKKRCEVLQMAILEPALAIMDETDSGLDIDALRIVAEGVNSLRGPDLGVLMITHYQRLLNYIKPDFVHVLANGQIVDSGGPELALELEDAGYDQYTRVAEKV